jgi:hypothetical protein
MFKVGDKVVYIDDKIILEGESIIIPVIGLILNKIYIVKELKYNLIIVEGINNVLSPHRFISLPEYRKLKIKKICTKLEIK